MQTAKNKSIGPALPSATEQLGFRRTVCDCAICTAPCRHMPGTLDVADLARLSPPDHDLFAWAEKHLRALTEKSVPTLVPARQHNGHCHWHFDGKCAVHESAPFGCAFFDSHMPEADANRRRLATIEARKEDAAKQGLYYQVWIHLRRKGLIAVPGDREALADDLRKIQRQSQRNRRRSFR